MLFFKREIKFSLSLLPSLRLLASIDLSLPLPLICFSIKHFHKHFERGVEVVHWNGSVKLTRLVHVACLRTYVCFRGWNVRRLRPVTDDTPVSIRSLRPPHHTGQKKMQSTAVTEGKRAIKDSSFFLKLLFTLFALKSGFFYSRSSSCACGDVIRVSYTSQIHRLRERESKWERNREGRRDREMKCACCMYN